MANALPDELIKEILSPVLKVPDKMFEDTSEPSPFCRFEVSTSALLVVCKRWLRVATPLLYEVLVVRSKAQAQALARVLVQNPEFGNFVRKIRLEGGYGAAAGKILLASPHLTDIFLRMPIVSSDSSSGLVSALPRISPKRAILYREVYASWRCRSKQDEAIQVILMDCIKHHWDRLTSLLYTGKKPEFFGALKVAPCLKHLTIPDMAYISTSWLCTAAENPSIERIEIHQKPRYYDSDDDLNEIYGSERLTAVIELPQETQRNTAITQKAAVTRHNRDFIPMASAPEAARREIWTRVIEWVAQMPVYAYIADSRTRWDVPTKRCLGNHLLQIMLTSKLFLSVARPILYKYAHVYLLNSRGRSFIPRLRSEPGLRDLVHSLFIDSDRGSFGAAAAADVSKLIELTPNLVGLYGLPDTPWGGWTCPIDWDGFELLAKTAGHSLSEMLHVEITVSAMEGPKSPTIFAKFDRLHTLQWRSKVGFIVSPKTLAGTENFLSKLERLSFDTYDASFVKVLAGMRLPVLKTLALPVLEEYDTPFFKSHGSKIHDLWINETSKFPVFDLCPNLKTIAIEDRYAIPDGAFFSSKRSHRRLEKIFIAGSTRIRNGQDKLLKDEEASWSTFFELLDLGRFPALREIQLCRAVWPTNEHQMQKNSWWKWVEGVMKKWDVSFTDAKGTRWRPRLKASRARR